MTRPVKQPTREQIRNAFEWTARWHSGGAYIGEADLSDHAAQVLGGHAYTLIATGAREWRRRNTTTNGGQRISWLDIQADPAYHAHAKHNNDRTDCAYCAPVGAA
jgi:hypothetical protein